MSDKGDKLSIEPKMIKILKEYNHKVAWARRSQIITLAKKRIIKKALILFKLVDKIVKEEKKKEELLLSGSFISSLLRRYEVTFMFSFKKEMKKWGIRKGGIDFNQLGLAGSKKFNKKRWNRKMRLSLEDCLELE